MVNKVQLKELLELANINNWSNMTIYADGRSDLFVHFDNDGTISNMENIINSIDQSTLFNLDLSGEFQYLIIYTDLTCEYVNMSYESIFNIKHDKIIKFIYKCDSQGEIINKAYDFKVKK